MRHTLLLITAAGAFLSAGCGPTLSIHPLYEDADIVSDLPLEGLWTDQDAKETWNVRRAESGYEIADKDEKMRLQVVRLEGLRFLDITSEETSLSIPGHLIVKAWIEGEELCAQAMDTDWLKQKVRETGFPNVELSKNKQVILTASTPVLRKFVLLYANEPRAFSEVTRFPGALTAAPQAARASADMR
jgi:hypothetical protein